MWRVIPARTVSKMNIFVARCKLALISGPRLDGPRGLSIAERTDPFSCKINFLTIARQNSSIRTLKPYDDPIFMSFRIMFKHFEPLEIILIQEIFTRGLLYKKLALVVFLIQKIVTKVHFNTGSYH